MPKTYTITAEEARMIMELRKEHKDKQLDKRLRAVQLRGEGMKHTDIAKILETSTDMVSRWAAQYAKGGVDALMPKKRTGHHTQISYEEEAELLERFKARAEAGQVVEVSMIKEEYQQMVGHNIGSGQIYRVLKRHGWRKIMPRSRHPKKASPEAIEASKKLTHAPND